jgi:acyl-coenzyme A thioesterase PaaI-like protein
MDFELMRAGLEQAVPFNQHVGLEVAELATGRCVVRLPDDGTLRNHTGSQHASALFAAGEAASGGALITAFVEHLEEVTPMPDGADIRYLKLARGPIVATAVLGADPDDLLAELARSGDVRFGIDVSLVDSVGDLVADMTVRWAAHRDIEA